MDHVWYMPEVPDIEQAMVSRAIIAR
jgi:hypothetical protein